MRLFSLRFLIFRGRTSDLLLEIFSEKGLIGEVQHVGHLLYGVFAALEQSLRFENNEISNPVAGKTSAYLMDDLRQIFRRYAQHVRIVRNTALFRIAFLYLVDKLRIEFLPPAALFFQFFGFGIGSE